MVEKIDEKEMESIPPLKKKKYIITIRNKGITSRAVSIDDFIKVYKRLANQMIRWKKKGVSLDKDNLILVGDEYAQFCTYDEDTAIIEGFEEDSIEEWRENSSHAPVLEFTINSFLYLLIVQN